MKWSRCLLALLCLVSVCEWLAQGVRAQENFLQPGPGRFFVSPGGNDQWSGKLVSVNSARTDGPFATLARAQQEMRKERLKSVAYVRGGTYYLREPLVLTPEDSGTRYEAYPGEHPILSGGRAITGWRQYTNSILVAPIPEARSSQMFFGQLWFGKDLQTRARYPNVDPANPYTSGWSYITYDGPRVGAFGAYLSRIHNTNDWIDWTIDVPMDGDYRVAFYYAAQNAGLGYSDLAGRMTLQVGAAPAVPLQNLPDTGAFNVFRWSKVATLSLLKGKQIIRWINTKGGAMSLDALVLSDDPAWNPNGPVLPPVAPGKNRIIVQAESFSGAQCKEMVVPATGAPAYRNRFQFRAGDVKMYPLSPEPEVHVFPGNGALNTILQVKSIDMETRAVNAFDNTNSIYELRVGNRFFISNVFEELDSAGEWYFDRSGGNLYFWPPKGDFQKQNVVAPVLDRLIEFKGDPAANKWVEQVTITGFEFSHTTYSRGMLAYLPSDAAIVMSGAKKCVLEKNRFINLGGNAIRLENRSAENEIVGNEIGQTGEGGVILVGTTATQPTDNLIGGNWMHHLGQVYKHVAGVFAGTASGTHVTNNRFEYLPRNAIAFESFDAANDSHKNTAEYNDIQFTNLETAEGGAIETFGRNQKNMESVIQYNRILDTTGLGVGADGKAQSPFLSWGILLDEYSSGVTVQGNLVVRTDSGGGCINGGRGNIFANNIFAEGGEHQMRYQLRDAFCAGNRFTNNIVVYSSVKADIFNVIGTWRNQAIAESNRNLFWHAQGLNFFKTHTVTPYGTLAKWQAATFDRASVIENPLFADPGRDNYQLKPESPALALGFQPIPFEKIGLTGYARAWKK